MRKSALPNAVRNTLSKAALDVKQNTMPKSAKGAFVQRKPQFFKVASTVVFAKGANISLMKSATGFKQLPKDKGRAVDDLKQQEFGGKIGGRDYVALKGARSAKSWHKGVRKDMRIAALDSMIDSDKASGKNDKQKFVKSAIYAGVNGLVRGNIENSNGARKIYLVNKIMRKGKQTVIGKTAVYSEKDNRQVKPPATHFMGKAAEQSSKKVGQIFINEAAKQINRL
jgi:hypothetical protein